VDDDLGRRLDSARRFWGASGNQIFPFTADLPEREVFWALADLFDADAFITYAPTQTEMRDFAPDAVDDFLERAGGELAFEVQPTPGRELR